MQQAKTVGLISKPGVGRARRIVPELFAWLGARGLKVRYDRETAGYLDSEGGMDRSEVAVGADLIVLLGGDGTLLSAVRAMGGRQCPLFAVNLGGLGFLTAITVDELYPELERALRGEQRIGRRKLLRCELYRDGEMCGEYQALNDVVISKVEIARMIDIDTCVDQQLVCAYKADGLIVSTPTGSTAYSLSAGGPIVFPTVEAIVVTPICPHTLTNRPVVVPLDRTIRLEMRSKDTAAFLTIDGQVGEPLQQGDEVICRNSDKCLLLVRPPRQHFFDVLRQKLRWGER